MAVIKQLKDSNGTQQIFPKTTTQAIYNPDGTTLQSKLNTIYGDIATIETSPSVSAHAVGTYIVYNGQLYRVKAAIAANEALVVGTNIVATSVGNELGNVSDVTASYSININGGSISAKKIGKIVLISGFFKPQNNTASNTNIASISDTFIAETYQSVNSSEGNNVRLKLKTNGIIQCETAITNSEFCSFTFVSIGS